MIIFGGLGDNGTRFNDLYVLDLHLQEWSQLQTAGTLPEPRSHHGTVLYGDKLIVFGGLSGVSAERLNTVHILDLEKRPWTWSHPVTLGTPPTGRLYPTLTVWKNQVCVFAGYTGKHRLNDIHFLDLATMTWSEPWTRDEKPNPVYGHSGTQLGSKLLVFGGNTGVSYYENYVYIMDFETMLWRRLPDVDCPSGRRYHTAVLSTSTQKLYVYGGSTATKIPEDYLYVLDTTLIPGLGEWTFDEAQDIIRQGIRAFSRSVQAHQQEKPSLTSPIGVLSPSLSSGGIDISKAKRDRASPNMIASGSPSSSALALNMTPSLSSSPSSATSASQAAPSSARKRKKSRGDAAEETRVAPPSSSSEVPLATAPSSAKAVIANLPAEDQATEAVRLLKLHFKRLKREKEELRFAFDDLHEQQRRFEEMSKQMTKYVSEHGEGDVIKLNVGGVTFQTTRVTLVSHPDSMLAAMFSGRYKLPADSKGHIFIDRDGTHFRYILNFLRDGTLNVPPDHILLLDILQEAQFYQLHKLVQLVKMLLKDLYKPSATLLNQGTAGTQATKETPNALPSTHSSRTRITAAHRAFSISELRDHPTIPRTGTSPDFDDYWGNL